MKTKEQYLRVNFIDWKRLKKYFPGKKGESVAEYFKRLVDDLTIINREV